MHRLDPRVKLVVLLAWTAALFWVEAWAALALVAVGVACLMRCAGVSPGGMARGVAALAVVFAVMVFAGALRFDGSGAWAVAGPVGIAPEGLERGLKAVVRIVLMVGFSLVVSATTSVTALTESLLALLSPLRRLHVPVDDFATMLSIAIRFMPVCAEQHERIVLARRARGAEMRRGGPAARARSWASVMITLFVGLFRRSDALAAAMTARCYRGSGRTCLTTLRLTACDVGEGVAALVLAAVLAFLF